MGFREEGRNVGSLEFVRTGPEGENVLAFGKGGGWGQPGEAWRDQKV